MSHYRLSFLEGLGVPDFTTAQPPRKRIWQGTQADLHAACRDRVTRMFRVLLDRAAIKYAVGPDGILRYGDKGVEADLVAQLWNDANVLVSHGKDLH
jgi:hypothetical protein